MRLVLHEAPDFAPRGPELPSPLVPWRFSHKFLFSVCDPNIFFIFRPEIMSWDDAIVDAWKDLTAGIVGGFALVGAGHPLDTVRIYWLRMRFRVVACAYSAIPMRCFEEKENNHPLRLGVRYCYSVHGIDQTSGYFGWMWHANVRLKCACKPKSLVLMERCHSRALGIAP